MIKTNLGSLYVQHTRMRCYSIRNKFKFYFSLENERRKKETIIVYLGD